MINLSVWTLERSIHPEAWEPFRQELLGIRDLILDIWTNEEEEVMAYNACLQGIEIALNKYRDYIQANELLKTF